MDLRSMLNQVKSAFVIGKDNPFLHGRQGGQPDYQGYEAEPDYAAPQVSYAPGYQQPAYQAPYQQAAPQAAQQAYQQPVYQNPYQPQQPQQAYQQPAQIWQQPRQQEPAFQTQISPEPYRENGRVRRSQQHQESQQPAYQAPQPPENVVPFPGVQQPQESRQVDAYVINVFNIASCRQAMSCLRKGQCTLIVMDQLIDKAEIRRYVDMLTGACYALNGTMTRLSAKIGFYIMAPGGMTVYTDPVTSNANAQPRPAQTPLYRPSAMPNSMPQQRSAGSFAAQNPYAAAPGMTFTQSQAQPGAAQPAEYEEPEAPEAYAPYQEQPMQRYQAQ